MSTIELTDIQQAAVVVAQMPDHISDSLLRMLSEVEVNELSKVMIDLPDLQRDVVHGIVGRFLERVELLAAVRQGGPEAAERLLRAKYGPARAQEEMAQLLGVRSSGPLAALHRLEPGQVADFLADQHPQIIAAVLAHMPSDVAAEALNLMEEEVQGDVAYRIATMGRVSPDVFDVLADGLNQQLAALLSVAAGAAVGGVQSLANVLNRIEHSREQKILAAVELVDKELAEAVRVRMFTFDDLVRLDERTMQKVARSLDPSVMAVALKDADARIKDAFVRSLSERAGEELAEEILNLGPTRRSEIDAAQMEVIKHVRTMDEAGEIIIVREGDEVVV